MGNQTKGYPLLYVDNTFGTDDNVLSELLINLGLNNIECVYEDELRIIMSINEPNDYFRIIKAKPLAVYLGEFISGEDEDSLCLIRKRNGINIYKMFSNPSGNLKLEMKQL